MCNAGSMRTVGYNALKFKEVCLAGVGWDVPTPLVFFNLVCGRSFCIARSPIGRRACYWEEPYRQQKGKGIEVRKSIM